jgi:hypothetical protein
MNPFQGSGRDPCNAFTWADFRNLLFELQLPVMLGSVREQPKPFGSLVLGSELGMHLN